MTIRGNIRRRPRLVRSTGRGWLAGLVLVGVALAGALPTAGAAVLRTCPGQDWSVPEGTRRTAGTGLFTMGVESRQPEVEHRGITLTWAELNPAPGRMDWAPVREVLEAAERRNHGVVLRIKASVTRRRSPWGPLQAVPQWILDREQPIRAKTRDRGPRDFIEVAVPWDAGVQAAYLEFVEAFGRQGFARHPRLLGVYVHGVSTSFGEEMWLDAAGYRRMRVAGLTPQRMREVFGARIRAWAEAFGAEAHRLGWVGAGWIAAGDESGEYRRVRRELDALALELGLGRRWGNIESYNGQLDEYGQQLHADGRLETDPEHPLVAEPRFFAAENENWSGERRSAFAYRRAVQRALQMGIRLLWVRDDGVALDPVISGYFARVAGKGPETSPDAWSVLRQTEVRVGRERRVVGNLERGLRQLEDAPQTETRAVRPVSRPPQSNDWERPREWTARATAVEEGRSRMRFALDPRFVAPDPEAPLLVQVAWIDDGGRWRLATTDEEEARDEDRVRGAGDGREKTTTFLWSEPAGRFDLVAEKGDLTVSVVRVVRATPDLAIEACAPASAAAPPSAASRGGGHG